MSELPVTWISAAGHDLFEQVRGVTYDKTDERLAPGPGLTPLLRAQNIVDGNLDLGETNFVPTKIVDKRQILRRGDVIIASSSGSRTVVGKAAVFNGPDGKYAFGAFCTCLRPIGNFSPYLWRYMQSSEYRRYVEAVALGTNINNFRSRDIDALPVPLAPEAEQRRIITKLDAASARSKRASAELQRVEALVERARQAVLAAAFEPLRGAPRRTLSEELAVLTSGSRDWAQYYDRGSGVFVLAGNIRPLFFDPSPKRFVDPPRDGADARRSRIARGDLLLTIVGAGTGDLCHVEVDVPDHFVCQSVALLRLRRPGLAKFLAYWFNWIAGGRGDINEAMYGAARPHLSFEQIKGFLVPIPTDEEARTAVARIDAGLSALARLVAEARAANGLVSRLDQSILSRAFRGELVPQDPADEPAGVLLDRIRARVSTQASKRRRRAG